MSQIQQPSQLKPAGQPASLPVGLQSHEIKTLNAFVETLVKENRVKIEANGAIIFTPEIGEVKAATSSLTGPEALVGAPKPRPMASSSVSELQQQGQVFVNNLAAVAVPESTGNFDKDSEALTLEYLKLNLQNPNNSFDAQQNLHNACSKLRSIHAKNADKNRDNALKKAEKLMRFMGKIGGLMVALQVISLAAMLIPGGQGMMLAVQAAKKAATEGVKAAIKAAVKAMVSNLVGRLAMICGMVTAATKLTSAGIKFDINQRQNKIDTLDNKAEKNQKFADDAQGEVKEHGENMQQLKQLHNDTVGYVQETLNQQFSANNALSQWMTA